MPCTVFLLWILDILLVGRPPAFVKKKGGEMRFCKALNTYLVPGTVPGIGDEMKSFLADLLLQYWYHYSTGI